MLSKVNLPLTHVEQSNFRHLVWDIAWFGLAMAATSRFLSVFAIRLGASATDLSWLTALPALILLVSSSVAGLWVRRFSDANRALRLPGLFFRFVFLLPAFAPFMPDQWQTPYLILAASLPSLVQGTAATAFVLLMRSSMHDAAMPALLSRRSTAMNITVGIGALAFGLWLDYSAFPTNYQLMYVLAFVFAIMSWWHCLAVDPSPNECPLASPPRQANSPASEANPWRSHGFRAVAVCIMIAYIAYFSVYALVPLHLVKTLGASEGFIALYGIIELAAGAAVGLVTTRVVARIGNRAMVALSMIGTGIAVMIAATATSLPITLLAAALSGASWTAVAMIGLFAYFSENAPQAHMSAYSVAYHQVLGLATFIGPLIGSFLAGSGLNLVAVLLIGSVLRLAAAPLIDHSLMTTIKTAGQAVIRLVKVDHRA
ncbi:MAG: MFS transporter [bacterium]|nr:MFS transporter [bacterium]